MRKEFQNILEAVEAGRTADLVRTVNGETLIRRFLPPERLILLGGGHVSLALYEAALRVGFAVTVVDDRPAFASYARFPEAKEVVCDSFEGALPRLRVGAGDFVCVLTRGHRDDVTCVKYLLQGNEPRYLGMIGSHRRVKGLFELLGDEGYDRARMARIHAPIGLDIHAVTPAEIAVSILAEIISVKNERHAASASRELLSCREHGMLCIIVEKTGSSPRGVGSMMFVSEDRVIDSIGGGAVEFAAIEDARAYPHAAIREYHLNNRDSEHLGMICGGSNKVLFIPV